ncbi:hypothetical protein D3C71_1258200 [compost metagenome]
MAQHFVALVLQIIQADRMLADGQQLLLGQQVNRLLDFISGLTQNFSELGDVFVRLGHVVHIETGRRRIQSVDNVVHACDQRHNIVTLKRCDERLVQFSDDRVCERVALRLVFLHFPCELLKIAQVGQMLREIIGGLYNRIRHILKRLEENVLFSQLHYCKLLCSKFPIQPRKHPFVIGVLNGMTTYVILSQATYR